MGTGYWSYVELADLDETELAALLLEGWSSIVPKKVSKPYLLARQANQNSAHPGESRDPS